MWPPQVTRTIIRKCVSTDGTESEMVPFDEDCRATVTKQEGDRYSKVVTRTVLKSEGGHTEVCSVSIFSKWHRLYVVIKKCICSSDLGDIYWKQRFCLFKTRGSRQGQSESRGTVRGDGGQKDADTPRWSVVGLWLALSSGRLQTGLRQSLHLFFLILFTHSISVTSSFLHSISFVFFSRSPGTRVHRRL